mmetsp:Transcript_35996/g.83581  ORF Transcript_35996/g.83581 Transcript_35996/m.83581 type:complete len:246 (+) Transcript_35996:52-789(+)
MIPPVNSLVRYDNPILVSTTHKDRKGKKGKPQAESKATTQTEDILHSILPPREWTEDGELWVQYVSSQPATRLDVQQLQEELDKKLQQRQARETGICPIREELYSQCFDELIREVTIILPERGLLLLRVRDEMRMTVAAYQTLYESSVAYAVRKALQGEMRKAEIEAMAKQLEAEKKDLERQVQELSLKRSAIEKRETERWSALEKKHVEEIATLKASNQQIRQTLETALAPPPQFQFVQLSKHK